MSPIDFHNYDEPYGGPYGGLAQLWRWLNARMWSVERAFERAKTSGRAVDDTRLRIFFILAIFALAFVTLGLRATRAALFAPVGGAEHAAAGVGAARADLVDRDGRLLAVDLPHYGLYVDPREIWDTNETRRKLLSSFPKLPRERLERALHSGRREYLAGGLTPQEMQVIHDLGLPGVSFEEESRRVYPLGPTAEHLIGFTDAGGRGLAGAEKALDAQIRDPSSDGPVQLAMDLRVQAALQDELQKAMAKYQTLNAMGMVVNVHTGEILATASLPDFDPNAPGKSPIPNLTNHEFASVYELGSVFKAFTIAMGLDTGVVNIDTTFDVHAPLQIGSRPVHDFDKGDTTLALWQVFTHSSNIGAAKLAILAGPQRTETYFRRFGLFKAAPSEMFESARPILPRKLDDDTLAHIAFGQGISVSPLALATGYTALMNGGEYIPLTIRKVKPGTAPKGVRVISEQTSYTMLQLMRMNVHTDPKGSGHKADVLGLRVGGKTGSAQKPENGHYGKNNVSSFVAVFPTDGPVTADRYMVIITLDSPHVTPDSYGFITAGWNAAPVAGAVINRIAPFLGVQRVITADAPTPGADKSAKPTEMAE
jgi:cell division protein FtsI (penicillin-binding protein 3)